MVIKDAGPAGSEVLPTKHSDPYSPFYAWSARDGDGDGACGVTDQPVLVATRLREALGMLPRGACGLVELVRLDRHASRPAYVHGAILARAHWDNASGRIILTSTR